MASKKQTSSEFLRGLKSRVTLVLRSRRMWPAHHVLLAWLSVPGRRRLQWAVASATAAAATDALTSDLRSLTERHPAPQHIHIELSRLLADSGDKTESLRILLRAADTTTASPNLLRTIVDRAIDLRDGPTALQYLDLLTDLQNDPRFCASRLATVRRQSGDRDAELGALDAWVEAAPGNVRARLQRAECLTFLGRFDEALSDLRAVAPPGHSAASKRLFRELELQTGEREESACTAAELALAGRLEAAAERGLLSSDESAHWKATQWLLEAGLAARARTVLERLATSWVDDRDGDRWHRLGVARELDGDPLAAAEAYRRTIAAGHEAPEGYTWDAVTDPLFDLGRALAAGGRLDDAAEALREWGARTVRTIRRPVDPDPNAVATDPAFDVARAHERRHSGDFAGAADAMRDALRHLGHVDADLVRGLAADLRRDGDTRAEVEAWLSSVPLGRVSAVSRGTLLSSPPRVRAAVYAEYLREPLAARTILFQSSKGDRVHCNPLAIYRQVAGDERFRDWRFCWAVRPDTAVPEDVRSDPRVHLVDVDSDRYVHALATSAYLVNNVAFSLYFGRRPEQQYLNTWHGTPLKALGIHAKDAVLGYGNIARNVLNCTHLGMPNQHTADAMVRGMGLAGLVTAAVHVTGSPRSDITVTMPDATRAALRRRLGVEDGRPVVLFAPTWKGQLGGAVVSEGLFAEIEAMAGAGHHLLFRAHRFAERAIRGRRVAARTVPGDIDTNELLAIVDVLVTDYSSICFDFLPTGRPIIFHVPDADQYQRDRGFQLPEDQWPGIVSHELTSTSAVISRVCRDGLTAHEEHVLAEGMQRFCSAEDGKAAARTVEMFFFGEDLPDVQPQAAGAIEYVAVATPHSASDRAGLTAGTRGDPVKIPVLKVQCLRADPRAAAEFSASAGDTPHVLDLGGTVFSAEERLTDAISRRPAADLSAEQSAWRAAAERRDRQRRFGGPSTRRASHG